MDDDAPTIPVRMNKRTTVTTLRHMNGDHLLGLRDVIRSETGPYVRCNNEVAEDTKRKQVNVYFKDQRWQLEKIKREQKKFYKHLVKVQRDKRKGQREEYKRKQEEIRQDLQNIRLRRLIKRVVDKFRQNVKRKKAERARKRFAIAGGMRSYTDGGVAKHGVFGVKSQPVDSVTRMVKLAAKKRTLQKEGLIPTEQPMPHRSRSPNPSKKQGPKEGIVGVNQDISNADETQNSKGGNLRTVSTNTLLLKPVTEKTHSITAASNETEIAKSLNSNTIPTVTNSKTVVDDLDKRVRKEAEILADPKTEPKPSIHKGPQVRQKYSSSNEDSKSAIPNPSSPSHKERNNSTVTKSKISRLTEENLAVHEQELQGNEPEQKSSVRFPLKTTVLEVNRSDVPTSKVLHEPQQKYPQSVEYSDGEDTSEPQHSTLSGQIESGGDKLGPVKVIRRSTIRPPPFLETLDEVDTVHRANESNIIEEKPSEKPKMKLSRLIRLERQARHEENIRALKEELVPHYKRKPDGKLEVQMLPFVRASFIPPSNKIRYQQEKWKKEEKINMARQRVRIRNFVHQCPVAEPVSFSTFKSAPVEESNAGTDLTASLNQASLATLMFNVYHKEMPPEGVDPNSVEALKKCRYIRYFDLVKNRKAKENVFRKQYTSWDSPTASEQERRKLALLRRQQQSLFR